MKSKLYFVLALMLLVCGAFQRAPRPVVNAFPIEWMSFKGNATPTGNLLTWATSLDIHTKGFEIERLNPNNIGWETLGFVNGNLNKVQYQFIDNQPFTMTYYRLRAVNFEGNKTASIAISVLAQRTPTLKAYPNPVHDYLKVEFTEVKAFQIFDLLGQLIMKGQTAQYIPVFSLPKGTYILKMGNDQIKFAKQ